MVLAVCGESDGDERTICAVFDDGTEDQGVGPSDDAEGDGRERLRGGEAIVSFTSMYSVSLFTHLLMSPRD